MATNRTAKPKVVILNGKQYLVRYSAVTGEVSSVRVMTERGYRRIYLLGALAESVVAQATNA